MKILVVEDDPQQAERLCSPFGPSARRAGCYEDALAAMKASPPDIIILDAVFPLQARPNQIPSFLAGKFLDALDDMWETSPLLRPDVVLISGAEQPPSAYPVVEEWLRSNRISDVLPKGVSWGFFLSVLDVKVDRLWERRQLSATIAQAEGAFEGLRNHGIVTSDPQMAQLWRRLCQAAQSGGHTFIVGEIGVGKNALPKIIAELRNKSFFPQHCGQPAELFPEALFGSVPGAFTGAENKAGWIELAADGVLFLDEFCSMPLKVQYQLQRLLERDTREYSRLGDNKQRVARCMFVFADNCHPLEACGRVDDKRLLPQLASRVGQLIITVPPLRDRRTDIPLLTDHFLAMENYAQQKDISLEPDVYEVLQAGEWRQGNVRSLRNVITTFVTYFDRGPIGLSSIFNELNGEERRLFQEETGWDFNKSRIAGYRNVISQSSDPESILISLRADLFGTPSSWIAICGRRRCTQDQELQIFELLRAALLSSDPDWRAQLVSVISDADPSLGSEATSVMSSWLDSLKLRLEAREPKDPATHLFYGMLLYLTLRPDHQATRADLVKVLARAYTQITRLGDDLMTKYSKNIVRSFVGRPSNTPPFANGPDERDARKSVTYTLGAAGQSTCNGAKA